MKGKVNENLVSYSKVVSAGRKARQFEILNKELDSLYERYRSLIGETKTDYSGLCFALYFLHSLAEDAKEEYDSLLNEHIKFLESR